MKYYLVQFTWCLLENILGAIMFLILLIFRQKPKKFLNLVYFEIGEDWGGFNIGFCAVVNKNPSAHILKHELGHHIQSMYFGPFELIIQLCSVIRYWYRRIIIKYDPIKGSNLPPYDSIWFEDQATKLGEKIWLKNTI